MSTRHILASCIASVLRVSPLFAVIETWDGGGANSNISTAANWADNSAPASSLTNTDLIFTGTVRPTPTLDADLRVHSGRFESIPSGFEIQKPFVGFHTLFVGEGGIRNADPSDFAIISTPVDFSLVTDSFVNSDNALRFLNTIQLLANLLSIFRDASTTLSSLSGTGKVFVNTSAFVSLQPFADLDCDFTLSNTALNVDTPTGFTLAVTFSPTASIAVSTNSLLQIFTDTVLNGARLTRSASSTVTILAGKN